MTYVYTYLQTLYISPPGVLQQNKRSWIWLGDTPVGRLSVFPQYFSRYIYVLFSALIDCPLISLHAREKEREKSTKPVIIYMFQIYSTPDG